MELSVQTLSTLAEGGSLVLGSDACCDFTVVGYGVEPKHAQIRRRGGILLVRDLDSREGTFVNGKEVRGLIELCPGDRLRIGRLEMTIPRSGVPAPDSPNRQVHAALRPALGIALVGATKQAKIRDGVRAVSREILHQVSVVIRPGEFIGILGASGSGKSTLMGALAGNVPLSGGQILVDGQPVRAERLRRDQRIAYLPQDVVIHEVLTPLVALGFIAGLKGLADSVEQRQRLASEALKRVGLGDRTNVPIRRLSGGQRKRVALAAELLGDPGLILLDEATSGLDPATEEEMMRLFRELASEARTVVCITHFPARLDLCDRLLVVAEGRLIFFGTPVELRTFFGVTAIEDVFARQKEKPAEEWQRLFTAFPAGRVQPSPLDASTTACSQRNAAPAELQSPSPLRQAIDLTDRYLRIQLADVGNLVLMSVQAPIIGMLIGVTFGDIRVEFAELHAADTKQVHFLLALSLLWCTGTCSVREIVRELPIVSHERRSGLTLVPYLISKFVVLGSLGLVQAVLLLTIVGRLTSLTGESDPQYVVLGVTALVGVGVGLTISACCTTSEKAMTALPVVLIGQAIFSGGLARLSGWPQLVGMTLAPAYWTLDGLRSTLEGDLRNATYPGAPGRYQPPILGSGGPLSADLMALSLQLILMVAVTRASLSRQLGEPSRWPRIPRVRWPWSKSTPRQASPRPFSQNS